MTLRPGDFKSPASAIPPLRPGSPVRVYRAKGRVPPEESRSPTGTPVRLVRIEKVEATIGFEPMHRGFADPPLNRLGTSPRGSGGRGATDGNWLALEDSNLGSRIQSPLSYH